MSKKLLKIKPSFQSMIMSGALLFASSTIFTHNAFANEDDSTERAEGHHKRNERRGQGGGLMKGLNLSEEQRASIKELRQKNRSQMQSLMESHRSARKKLLEAQSNSDTSESELQRLFDAASSKRLALEEARFSNMLDIRKILTPEQRIKMQSKVKSRLGKGRRGKGERGE
ncbi:Spy/CpxP family protein refolding chaperone [bacterium]|nr:Spy/CpxP family protein refolding chaperone [bacterium]